MSSITDQNNDPLWVSLRKYLVIDVDEKQKELFKALEVKKNEQQNKLVVWLGSDIILNLDYLNKN